MLKILQARFQQYVNRELSGVQAGFRKGRGTRDQIANICWIIEKAREFQKNIYFCFIDYAKAFDCVDHHKLWKILKEMGISDYLTCLLRSLYPLLWPGVWTAGSDEMGIKVSALPHCAKGHTLGGGGQGESPWLVPSGRGHNPLLGTMGTWTAARSCTPPTTQHRDPTAEPGAQVLTDLALGWGCPRLPV